MKEEEEQETVQRLSRISNAAASKSGCFYVGLQNRKRNNTQSEIPLKEVVISICGRIKCEKRVVTLSILKIAATSDRLQIASVTDSCIFIFGKTNLCTK